MTSTPQPPAPLRAEGGFPVVGIVGGGQLARMCQPPAVALSVTLSVLAESETASITIEPTDSDRILIADFGNTTGDAMFDGTLKHALAVLEERDDGLLHVHIDGLVNRVVLERPDHLEPLGGIGGELGHALLSVDHNWLF